MHIIKKFLAVIIIGILLFGLLGCSQSTEKVIHANTHAGKSIVENDNKINLNNLHSTIPSDWTKRGNENEIFFDDKNKQTVGGISLIGYYGDYFLPNHIETLNSEDIRTCLKTIQA